MNLKLTTIHHLPYPFYAFSFYVIMPLFEI